MNGLLSNKQVAVILGTTGAAVEVNKVQNPHLLPKTTVDVDGKQRWRLEDVYDFLENRKTILKWALNREEAAEYLGLPSLFALKRLLAKHEQKPVSHWLHGRHHYFPQDLDLRAEKVGYIKAKS